MCLRLANAPARSADTAEQVAGATIHFRTAAWLRQIQFSPLWQRDLIMVLPRIGPHTNDQGKQPEIARD